MILHNDLFDKARLPQSQYVYCLGFYPVSSRLDAVYIVTQFIIGRHVTLLSPGVRELPDGEYVERFSCPMYSSPPNSLGFFKRIAPLRRIP